VPVVIETEKFVQDLIRWKKDPRSVDYLEEWHNNIYRQMVF